MTNFHKDKDFIEFLNSKRLDVQRNQVWQHYKGGLYIVEDIATHSETGEKMVVYRSLKTGELFVRPRDMFMDVKQTEEGYVLRFTRYFFE